MQSQEKPCIPGCLPNIPPPPWSLRPWGAEFEAESLSWHRAPAPFHHCSAVNSSETALARGTFNKDRTRGFPGSSVVKNLPAYVGDTGWLPSLGRSHVQEPLSP